MHLLLCAQAPPRVLLQQLHEAGTVSSLRIDLIYLIQYQYCERLLLCAQAPPRVLLQQLHDPGTGSSLRIDLIYLIQYQCCVHLLLCAQAPPRVLLQQLHDAGMVDALPDDVQVCVESCLLFFDRVGQNHIAVFVNIGGGSRTGFS